MSGMATTTMMERFHQLELDKNFIFVGAIGTGRQAESFTVKCKSCNASRRVWISVLKGKAKGFRCKVCGQSTEGALVSEVKTFYKNGNTNQATAEAFGMTQNQIRWLATQFHWDSPLNNANRFKWFGERIRGDRHKGRARKYGVEYVPGITLKKLVKRDGLTCKLCGERCDWDDKQRGACGPLYPSLDHIIPMVRGGGHVWSNVQVAHILCNSIKRDALPELINLEDEDVREVTA